MITFLIFVIALGIFISLSNQNFTKVSKDNLRLSRRKRYLNFPMGSNLVLTSSFSKPILQVQPRGWNTVYEMDVPFALPTDTRLHKNKKWRHLERRDIYSQLDFGFKGSGFNGTACVNRMICEAQKYIPMKGKSLINDMLLAVFYSSEDAANYKEECDKATWMECPLPLLDLILKSLE